MGRDEGRDWTFFLFLLVLLIWRQGDRGRFRDVASAHGSSSPARGCHLAPGLAQCRCRGRIAGGPEAHAPRGGIRGSAWETQWWRSTLVPRNFVPSSFLPRGASSKLWPCGCHDPTRQHWNRGRAVWLGRIGHGVVVAGRTASKREARDWRVPGDLHLFGSVLSFGANSRLGSERRGAEMGQASCTVKGIVGSVLGHPAVNHRCGKRKLKGPKASMICQNKGYHHIKGPLYMFQGQVL